MGGFAPDQARGGNRRLTVHHRIAIGRIGDHFEERMRRGIAGDEQMVPLFGQRAGQHHLHLAPPDDGGTDTRDDGGGVCAIMAIGLCPA